jgi:hypothetical protein
MLLAGRWLECLNVNGAAHVEKAWSCCSCQLDSVPRLAEAFRVDSEIIFIVSQSVTESIDSWLFTEFFFSNYPTNSRFEPNFQLCLPPDFTLLSCLVYSSTLKMEAIFSSETSLDFQRTTRLYIPVDRTLNNHLCEDLRSCIIYNILGYRRVCMYVC